MTVIAEPSTGRSDRPPPPGAGRFIVCGVLAALRAFVLGLVPCMLAGMVVVASGGDSPTLTGVVGLGGDIWLACHHIPLALPDGTFSLLPLGLVALPALLLVRAGCRLAREVGAAGLRRAGLATLALAVPYALAALVLALATLAQDTYADPLAAAAGTALLALLAGGYGVLRGARAGSRLLALLPGPSRSLLVAAAGAVATLLLAGAVLLAGMLAVRVIEVRDITASLHATGLAGVLLFLLGAAYVPNAVLFAVGYAAGPGFSLGAGSLIAPWHYLAGPVPAFPLLGAVPEGQPPGPAWAVLLGPALAGVVAGTLLVRQALPRSLPRAALWGLAPGPLTGLAAAALAALAG
ncbi:MAG: cell division protein PerM, partial [Streptosporangiales bacterium]